MKNTGGALVAKTLRRFGVKRLFTIPGHQTLSVLDGCLEEGITVVSTRHEAAAVHMAEGTSFATREPGVALLAGGPELTNGLTGLAKAFYANTPLLVVSGVNPPKKLDRGFPQDMNQLELVRPFTKWSRCCFDVIRIPEYLGAAFRHATSGRPGPVYLEIPYDVLEETVRDGSVRFPEPGTRLRPGGDEAALERARELLETAERPLAIAGSGVFWSGAEDELTTFAEKSGVPLYTTNAALTLPSPPELVTGLGSPAGGRPSLNAIAEADLILLFGTRVNFALGFGREPFMSDAQKLVQFDIDAAEIGAHRPIDVGVAGDLKATLTQFNQDLRITKDLESWKRRLSGEQESFEAELAPLFNSERVPIHPMRLVRELETARKPDSFLVLDGANSLLWMFLSRQFPRRGRTLISPMGDLEAIGTGIPHALALRLAHPDKQVILHVGDGSFGYYAMEFETALRQQAPFIAVVHNDRGWGMTRDMQAEFFGPSRQVGNELGLVRYDQLVASLGGYGELVEEPGELGPALRRAQESGLPACLNVLVDPEPKSPGLMMFTLMEVMLGKESLVDRVPELIRRLEPLGLGSFASKRVLKYLEGRLHKKMQ